MLFIKQKIGDYIYIKGKINAPMFAWSVYHNDPNPPFIRGTSPHIHKDWKGISVDREIPTMALNQLSEIKEIEGRASCKGTLTNERGDTEVPTYFIFRTINQDKKYVETLVKNLSRINGIKSGYGIGMEGRYRLAVVAEMSYETDPKGFITWWKNLPKNIIRSLP